MKKYIIFILSLAVLYFGFHIVSGFILTTLYVPAPTLVNSIPNEAGGFGETSVLPLAIILSMATIAYFLTEKLENPSK